MTSSSITLLDVRSEQEVVESSVAGSLNIPHSEIMNRLEEIPKDNEIAVFCRSGRRSAIRVEVLNKLGYDAHDIKSFEIAKRIYSEQRSTK